MVASETSHLMVTGHVTTVIEVTGQVTFPPQIRCSSRTIAVIQRLIRLVTWQSASELGQPFLTVLQMTMPTVE